MPEKRCYTAAEIRGVLAMTPRTWHRLKKAGRLPFLEELKPRVGRVRRYRADLVDRYLANKWQSGARRIA
jgi:hypothetical protein